MPIPICIHHTCAFLKFKGIRDLAASFVFTACDKRKEISTGITQGASSGHVIVDGWPFRISRFTPPGIIVFLPFYFVGFACLCLG